MARGGERWRSVGPLKGQNTTENPLSLGQGWAVYTRNVVLYPESAVAVKRKGSIERADTPAGTYMLSRHRPPGSTEGQAELWAFTTGPAPDYVKGIQRAVAGGAFAPVAFPAELTSVVRALTFNGRLFFGAWTTNNRLYCWDGTKIRPVGIVPGTVAPTAASGGTGPATPTARIYKVNWMRIDPVTGKITARSELTPGVTFTPSANLGVTITRPPVVPDEATHWRVWASADGGATFRRLADPPIPIATTTYTDSADPATYDGLIAPEVGLFLPPPSVLRLITDGNRLIMGAQGTSQTVAGAGEHVPKQNRVWYTPVLGSTDEGDDERVPMTSTQKNFIDLGENTLDGAINEIGGPVNGALYVAMQRRVWRLTPTGELTTPYLSYLVSDRYGATRGYNALPCRMMNGEDHRGGPAVYFLGEGGLYRFTDRAEHVSFNVIDKLVEPIWWREHQFLFGFTEQRQLWIVSAQADHGYLQPRIYVFHYGLGYPDENGDVQGGWTIWEVPIPSEPGYLYSSGCLYNRTPGSDDADKIEQVPYLVPQAGASVKVAIFDQPSGSDNGLPYRSSVTFAPWLAENGSSQFRVGNPVVVANALSGVELEVSATRDFGTETRRALISLGPLPHEGSPSRVVRTVEGLFQGDVTAVELEIGDPVPPAVPDTARWQVDWFSAPVTEQEPR